jgi:hypothetical protein
MMQGRSSGRLLPFDIYAKGQILTKEGVAVFYVLVSSKRSADA